MSEIRGYTPEEVAKNSKDVLVSDYDFCKRKLAEIRNHEKEIEAIRTAYNKLIARYRVESVDRVLEYIRAAKITDPKELDTLLCHCQNKLHGNIDGNELELKREVKSE